MPRLSPTLLRPKHWPVTLSRVPSTRRIRLLARIRFLSWWHRAPITVHIAPGVRIGKRINLEIRPHTRTSFSIGAGSTIGDDVRLRLRGGTIEIGEQVDLRATCILNVTGGRLVIEGPSNVSWGVVIHCSESVKIARFGQIAEYVTIVDSNHYQTGLDEWSYLNSRSAPIDLAPDVWVCPKATITMGVTIGEHVIVAPGSVVTKDVPANMLMSGVPAKIVRELTFPWDSSAVGDTESA